MKVLITGANGFVGQHLVRELKNSGINVVSVGGHTAPSIDGEECIRLDLSNQEEAHRELNFTGIDGVIHLAGLAANGPSFSEPLKYINVNSAIQINLMETALEQKCSPKFVVVSSGSVYDASAPLPITEKSPIKPSSPYSVSKLAQENLAFYYTTRGLECVIARPFNHIGPGQGPGFIVPDLAQQIVDVKKSGGEEIKVGNLSTKRDYTDVRDIVRAYRLLLEKGQSGEIYNICSGAASSGEDILNGLASAAGVNVKPVVDPSKNRPVDYPVIYGDHSKLEDATGWKPEIKLDTTLADVIKSM